MKIAFCVGKFDCLNFKHVHIVKEMRKYVFPEGKISALIFDDYPIFLREKAFPLQTFEHRLRNLKYICGADVLPAVQKTAIPQIQFLMDEAKSSGGRLIMVAYREDENIAEVSFCRAQKIPIRFIKPPSYAK